MMKCIYEYRFHGATYIKGNKYDIKPEVAEVHERYFGKDLWTKLKKASTKKAKK